MIQVSPGVNVSEFDATTVIPAVSTSVGAVAGVFQWGPAYQRTLINSETQLVQKFGKPNANNYETFFTAANFLAYGNALYVVRAYDSSALNAVANTTGAATAPQLDNYQDFSNTTLDANISYVARYAGSLGNSIKISVCDSAAVYSSNLVANSAVINFTVGSNVAVVNASSVTQGSGNTAANSVVNSLTVGDWIKVGNSQIGYQLLQVTGFTNPVGAESSSNGNYYSNGSTVSFATNYNLSTNISASSNTTQRYWEYYNAVTRAPSTTTSTSALGLTTQDEIHVVVADKYGAFTGTPNQILETWPSMSRATDAKTTQGATNFYKNVINLGSNFIYASGTFVRTGTTVGLANAIANSTTTTPLTAVMVSGADGSNESSIALGPIAQAYDLYKTKADVDISLLLQGKAIGSTTFGNAGLANYIIGNISSARKDCVAFISPDSGIIQSTLTSGDYAQYAVNFATQGITYASSYAVMDGNYKYQYDKYNDTYHWVPLNGDIAGLCAGTDYTNDPWWSPAGFNRGQIKNVTKLAYNPNQAQRDLLYINYINPVATFQSQGTVLYGDKTMIGHPSAFDHINVRRLFIVLEKAISIAAQQSLFEFNDTFTRSQFVNMVTPYLRQIQGRRGIYDFRVVCDKTNNTQAVIDGNQFVGDIYIQPARSINYITLNFVAVRTGVDFNTIVGTFGG